MARHKDQDLGSLNRKDQILNAAATLFANNGFYKTTTAMVAAELGLTQPYVFHFFKSKEELYLAVLGRAVSRLVEAFHSVEAEPEHLAERMGNEFNILMKTHRDEMLLCMHSFATPEPEVRAFVREQFASIHEFVTKRFADAGLPNPGPQASLFIAYGMAKSMGEVLELPQLGQLEPDHC